MVKRAFMDSRPYLLLSLIFGVSYYFIRHAFFPGIIETLWKGAGVGFLSVYALNRSSSKDGWLLGGAMALYALGDMLLEINLMLGGVAFIAGHLVAIILFTRNRRDTVSFSQKAFSLLILLLIPLISWALVKNTDEAAKFAIYAGSIAVVAAMAWTSVFPRYRVGAGALFLIVSDLLIFAREGIFANSQVPDLLIWPLYYLGQFLICTGLIQRLRRRLP